MKIKKVIYFTHFTFSERDHKRFGIETIKNKGFYVEVWDFAPFLNPRVHEEVKAPDPVDHQKGNYRSFVKKSDVFKRIKQCQRNYK